MRPLAPLLILVLLPPAQAQFMKNLVNPNVEVTLVHPPALGIPVRRVAFAPAASPAEEAQISACSAALAATGQVEVLDPGRVAAAFQALGLPPSGPGDAAAAKALGRSLGDPVLVIVRIQTLETARTRPPAAGGSRLHLARTRVALRATIRAADCTSGRFFPPRTVTARPFAEKAAPVPQLAFPPEAPLRAKALARLRTRVLRLLTPWTTKQKIIFFDDSEFGLKEAFLRLKAGDAPGALARSLQALDQARARPGTSARLLGRANFNVGICHFILGDSGAALPYLEAATQASPGHGMYRQALAECRHAHSLRKAGDL